MNERRSTDLPDFKLSFSYPPDLLQAMDEVGICPRPNWPAVIINALWEEVYRLRVLYGLREYRPRNRVCRSRHCKQRTRTFNPGPRPRPGRRD